MIVDIQFNQGSAPWSRMREAVIAADSAGYGTIWNLDHFSGEMFGSDSMHECFTSLTAWAAVTERADIGTLVTNVNNRHPGLLANIVSSIQDVSGGRLLLGIGAGASPNSPFGAEQRALGIEMLPTMAQRHQRLVDAVGTMRSIWAHDRDESYTGFPRPIAEPPIIAGVNSVELARIAGRTLDGINARFNHPDRGMFLRTAHEASGHRDDFDLSVWCPFDQDLADPDHPFHREIASEGANRLIMLHAGPPDPDVIARVGAEIAKNF